MRLGSGWPVRKVALAVSMGRILSGLGESVMGWRWRHGRRSIRLRLWRVLSIVVSEELQVSAG
jgi:hypothetical protein